MNVSRCANSSVNYSNGLTLSFHQILWSLSNFKQLPQEEVRDGECIQYLGGVAGII